MRDDSLQACAASSMSPARRTLLAVVVVAAVIGAAALWWNMSRPVPQAPVAAAPAPAPEPAAAPAQALPLKAADMGTVLADVLGRKAVLEFFALDEFPRRLVATVDNLGRSHAPPMVWPKR